MLGDAERRSDQTQGNSSKPLKSKLAAITAAGSPMAT